jgi:hypothetical protein
MWPLLKKIRRPTGSGLRSVKKSVEATEEFFLDVGGGMVVDVSGFGLIMRRWHMEGRSHYEHVCNIRNW